MVCPIHQLCQLTDKMTFSIRFCLACFALAQSWTRQGRLMCAGKPSSGQNAWFVWKVRHLSLLHPCQGTSNTHVLMLQMESLMHQDLIIDSNNNCHISYHRFDSFDLGLLHMVGRLGLSIEVLVLDTGVNQNRKVKQKRHCNGRMVFCGQKTATSTADDLYADCTIRFTLFKPLRQSSLSNIFLTIQIAGRSSDW